MAVEPVTVPDHATARSAAAFRRTAALVPRTIVGNSRFPVPIFLTGGDGCRVTDADGRRYIDLTMGLGANILGHRAPAVMDALAQQMQLGIHYGVPALGEDDLAELVLAAGAGAEQVVFHASGTEAVMAALRGARGHTGRPLVGIFEGGRHGWYDDTLYDLGPGVEPKSRMTGVVGHGDRTLVLPFMDAAAFDAIERAAGELAVVLVEPVQTTAPNPAPAMFLRQLRECCDQAGVLLAFDEVVTGFRVGPGGGAVRYGVQPDLVTYGKLIGGGLPVGAVAGRADVMASFAPSGGCRTGGTFSAHPLTVAAGRAVLEELRDTSAHDDLEAQSSRFVRLVNGLMSDAGVSAHMVHAGSMLYLYWQNDPVTSGGDVDRSSDEAGRALSRHLLRHGVLAPAAHVWFLSTAHTASDVDEVVEAIGRALIDMRADGLVG